MPGKGKNKTKQPGPKSAAASHICHGSDSEGMSEEEDTNINILEAILGLRSEIITIKEDICTTIDARIEYVSKMFREEMDLIRDEFRPAVDSLKKTSGTNSKKITDLEAAATYVSDLTTTLETEVKRLSEELKNTQNRCDSLEGFSRRNNLRIVGIKESVEGSRPTEFIAGLLKDTLALEEKPLLDRAHRSSRPKPQEGQRPRDFILRVHFFHVKMEIIRRARNATLTFQGQSFSIYQDFAPTVAKQRAAFGDVKRQLRDHPDVKYGLRFPARLWLTHEGRDHSFDTPEKAMAFVHRHIKKS